MHIFKKIKNVEKYFKKQKKHRKTWQKFLKNAKKRLLGVRLCSGIWTRESETKSVTHWLRIQTHRVIYVRGN